jgi:hypothetical protein
MGLPTYVANFDELIDMLDMSMFDLSEIKDILNKYFPELIEILKKLSVLSEIKGTQKIKGFSSQGEPVFFEAERDIVITGLTFSQNIFDGAVADRWSLKVANGSEQITLIDGVHSKDALQHKHFERFYPVPEGYEIIIEPITPLMYGKVFWVDVEYIEVEDDGAS